MNADNAIASLELMLAENWHSKSLGAFQKCASGDHRFWLPRQEPVELDSGSVPALMIPEQLFQEPWHGPLPELQGCLS